MLEKTIQTINQFEEEVFPQAKSSNRKAKQVKIPRAINDMLEEYERDTNLAITISKANNAQNEEARRAIQDKYRDLFELPKTRYREEYQYPEPPESPLKSLTDFNKSSTNQTIDRSGSSKQHIHSPKKPSSLRNSVDLTNTPDIVLPTPILIQNN
ncbi:11965_t:CDS:2 [Dentiscutata heterogama]|uniref:11965_t:CDS:1 n=1 Tax=Dentiscutata heterogama TaxID=1316150 RepID=A0ACA9LA44_9GLOM|nr:11965_t:CDS:2 [Dentiscutata heterogama]